MGHLSVFQTKVVAVVFSLFRAHSSHELVFIKRLHGTVSVVDRVMLETLSGALDVLIVTELSRLRL